MIINYLKNIGYTLLIILISSLIITFFNYVGILSGNTLKSFYIIFIILSLFIGGYLTGKKANKKGYLEGIKFGSLMIILIILLNLIIFRNKFTLINILYYVMLILSSSFGAMVGILRKK